MGIPKGLAKAWGRMHSKDSIPRRSLLPNMPELIYESYQFIRDMEAKYSWKGRSRPYTPRCNYRHKSRE